MQKLFLLVCVASLSFASFVNRVHASPMLQIHAGNGFTCGLTETSVHCIGVALPRSKRVVSGFKKLKQMVTRFPRHLNSA